jgi:glycosidase
MENYFSDSTILYDIIYDQLELSSDVFVGDSKLEALLAKYQQKGIIFFLDIVLNHTSFDSEWIKEN